jgi:hypothetical protein
MIAFITAYDDATNANYNVVQPIIPETTLLLGSSSANRENLWHHLPHFSTLFAMSHGNSDTLWDNENNAAINLADVALLTNKKAFVFACYTANDLGRQMRANSNIYWGYTGSIAAPTDEMATIPLFQSIFQYVIAHFSICESKPQIDNMLQNLKNLCDSTANEFDNLYAEGADINLMAYNCLNDIWTRLRVNHFDFAEAIKHPEAPQGDLFE